VTSKWVIRRHRRLSGSRWTFQLIAANGEPICSSEPYNSRDAAIAGIHAVKREAPIAEMPERP
jgi:uncharacterized protein YegP (UPF0339 family)